MNAKGNVSSALRLIENHLKFLHDDIVHPGVVAANAMAEAITAGRTFLIDIHLKTNFCLGHSLVNWSAKARTFVHNTEHILDPGHIFKQEKQIELELGRLVRPRQFLGLGIVPLVSRSIESERIYLTRNFL